MDDLSKIFNDLFIAIFSYEFSFGTIVAFGFFYRVGLYFGKLTKNIGLLKIMALFILGWYFYEMMKNFRSVLIVFFFLGILTNHRERIYFALYWASDLKDFLFALRYRRAYEDIRRREEELEQRERAFRDEQRRKGYADREQEQKSRSKWQSDAGGFRQEKRKSESRDTGGNSGYSSQSKDDKRTRCLKVLGLNPNREYSQSDLKTAYRKKAKKTHPDAGGSHDAFIEVAEAWEWLQKQ